MCCCLTISSTDFLLVFLVKGNPVILFSKPPFEMSRESYETFKNASQNIIITFSWLKNCYKDISDEVFLWKWLMAFSRWLFSQKSSTRCPHNNFQRTAKEPVKFADRQFLVGQGQGQFNSLIPIWFFMILFFYLGERSLNKFSSKQETTEGNNLPQGTFVFSRFLRRFMENVRKEIEKNNMKWSYRNCKL